MTPVARFRRFYDRNPLLVLWVAMAAIVVAVFMVTYQQQRAIDARARATRANVAQVAQHTAQLQALATALLVERAERARATCEGTQLLINSVTVLQPKPATVAQQYREQARLDELERVLEQNYQPFHCDFVLTPIPPPEPRPFP